MGIHIHIGIQTSTVDLAKSMNVYAGRGIINRPGGNDKARMFNLLD